MEHEVVAQGALERLAMEVEDGGLGEPHELLTDGCSRVGQCLAFEPRGPERLVHVIVKEPAFGVGDPAECIGEHAYELYEGVLGKSGREHGTDPSQCCDV